MKKILSFVLAAVLCLTTMSVAASADTVTDNGIFGAILDPDGNVVEYLTMPRSVYRNDVYTLSANYSLVTYQYEPSEIIYIGVSSFDENGNQIATQSDRVKISIEGANSIGASNRAVIRTSTQTLGGADDPSYINASVGNYRYYNGKITNMRSSEVTLRIIIVVDQDELPN